MIETFSIARSNFVMFFSNKFLYLIFLMCLLYLFASKGHKRAKIVLFWYSVGVSFIFWFPVTSKILSEKVLESFTYWRVLWLLPITLVIAYTATLVIVGVDKRLKRGITAVLAIGLIAYSGTFMYSEGVFHRNADNLYKVPNGTVEVCDAMETAATEYGDEEIRAIVVNDLVSYLRIYDANIIMPYGRNAFRGAGVSKQEQAIYDTISAETVDWEKLAELAEQEKYNYLVYNVSPTEYQAIIDAGYELVAENEFAVFRKL